MNSGRDESQAHRRDLIEGCLLGLALGDALGAPHEGGMLERLLWRAIGRTARGEMRWTDDTQMALDLAESLAEKGAVDTDDLARRFAASYRWSRGYGPGMTRLLKRIARGASWREANRSVFADGSYGNGGAMRAPVIALFYAGRPHGELADAPRSSAEPTHAHPLGMEGAVLTATATAAALQGCSPKQIVDEAIRSCTLQPFANQLALVSQWLKDARQIAPGTVRRRLGNGIAAQHSCVTAIYLGVKFLDQPFMELQRFIVRVGGDTDTLGAMAGAIWGAANGARHLPAAPLARLEQRPRLSAAADALLAAGGGVLRPA